MKTRQRDWINIRRPVKVFYSFQVFIEGHWTFLSVGKGPLKFKSEKERDAVRRVASKAKTVKDLDKVVLAAMGRK